MLAILLFALLAVRIVFSFSLLAYTWRYILVPAVLVAAYLNGNLVIILPIVGTVVLTNLGKEIIVDRIMGNGTEPVFIHWGTGAAAAAAAATGLSTPSTEEARTTGTSTKTTTTTADDTFTVTGTILCATSGKTITNAALFDDEVAGNIFVLVDSLATALAVGDGIAFTFNNKFA